MAAPAKSVKQVFQDTIFENLPEDTYIFWKDKKSVYLGCNENYANLLGLLSPEEIVGKTDMDFYNLPDGDSPELFQQGDQETLQGKHIKNQKEWLSVNGKKVLVLVSKAPLYADKEKKKVVGVLGVARDITERYKQDEELADTKYKLEAMTQVAASIAHELRTPLTSLDLGVTNLKDFLPILLAAYESAENANIIKHKLKSNTIGKLKGILDSMAREIALSALVINLLLENLKPEVDSTLTEYFSIAHCINDALNRYPFKPGQRELIDWKPDKDFKILGAEALVTHILFNFIKNSLHYIAEAGKGNIFIWLEENSAYNTLYFKDTSKGISEDILPNIFKQFFSKTYHGAGIGLSYCKAAVEKLGGQITCDSVYGDYTLFKLTFPIVETKS